MKIVQTVTDPPKPAVTREVVTGARCDLCGAEGGRPESEGKVNWGRDLGDFDETTISRSRGYRCSDGGDSKDTAYHVCPACWEKKLVPWLESQGARATTGECDW